MKYRDFPLRLPTSCSWWNWTSPVTVRSELSGGIDAPQSCFFAYCTAVCISVQRVRTVHSPAVICHGSGAVKICLFYCVSGCQQYLVSHFPHDGFSSSLFFFFFFPQTFQKFLKASNSANPWRSQTSVGIPSPGRKVYAAFLYS